MIEKNGELTETLQTLAEVVQGFVDVIKGIADLGEGVVTLVKYGFSLAVIVGGGLIALIVYIYKDNKKHQSDMCKLRHRRNEEEHGALFSALDEVAPRGVRTIKVIHPREGED